jgi:hypothetical protein
MLHFTGKTLLLIVLFPIVVIAGGAPKAIDPVSDTHSNRTYAGVYPRASIVLPTIQRIVQRMRPIVRPNKNLFFSGPGDYEFAARLYASQHDLNTITDFSDPDVADMAAEAGGTVQKEYWHRLSVAYAEVTAGEAYVLLPGEPAILRTNWYRGTIWDTVEWPILHGSRTVTRVLRVNPSMAPAQGLNIKPS